MSGKERLALVQEGILRCLTQLGHHDQSPDKNSSGKHSSSQKSPLVQQKIIGPSNQALLKKLLANQLKIIESQNGLLERNRKIIQNLKVLNTKLNSRLKVLKTKVKIQTLMKPKTISRALSPIGSDGDVNTNPNTISEAPCTASSVTRRTQRTLYHQSTIHKIEKEESGIIGTTSFEIKEVRVDIPVCSPPNGTKVSLSAAVETGFRKTRSSSGPENLVPSLDFSRKRRSSNNPSSSSDRVGIASIGKKTKLTPSRVKHKTDQESILPKIRFHIEDNYVSTSDPQFLPETLFKDVEEQEPMDPMSGVIEVPSWRKKHILPSQRPCVAEDLDEATYTKRHCKAEEDEKRRKRWDAQKLREDLYIEQLKIRLAQRAKNRRKLNRSRGRKTSEDSWDELPWIESFHPNPKQALYIQIEHEIPINVFGSPLPTFSTCDFNLPWEHPRYCSCLPNKSRSPERKV